MAITPVAPADSTYAFIEATVRKLTASSSEQMLPSSFIQQTVNNFYNRKFPNSIKVDQMRSVYTFYTKPYIDRYPIDVNYNQGFRAPFYVDGVLGSFFKDRDYFFNMWPRWPTLFKPISGDGTTQQFSFTVGATPFLSKQVTLGGTDTVGNAILVNDDGNGNMQYVIPTAQMTIPSPTDLPPYPGMLNQNTGNPGLNGYVNIGAVDYVTGNIAVDFSLAPGTVIPAAGTQMNLFVSQYVPARPYSLLFWNNEFTLRPVPKLVHKVEVECYLTPVAFLFSTDNPILNQWADYLAYGAAIDILMYRQDMAGVQNLMPQFKIEESRVLERQATEELFQRNGTIFSSPIQGQGNYFGSWGAW